jgi:hypothetical protein
MAFGADKPFVMKIAYAIFPPSLRFAQAGLAAQKIIRAMIMGQELNNIERMYDTVAKEYSETFSGEHEKKPKDQEILRRFSIDTII